MAGALSIDGALLTGAVAAEVAVATPALLVAVTTTSTVEPTSVGAVVYELTVLGAGMFTHSWSKRSQSSHR